MNCASYLDLFRSHPERALEPKAEYDRWRREDMSPEAKDQRKAKRLAGTFARLDRERDKQARRWETPPDPLED